MPGVVIRDDCRSDHGRVGVEVRGRIDLSLLVFIVSLSILKWLDRHVCRFIIIASIVEMDLTLFASLQTRSPWMGVRFTVTVARHDGGVARKSVVLVVCCMDGLATGLARNCSGDV